VLGKPVRHSPIQGDPAVLVTDEWLKPGDEKRVWLYVAGDLDPVEALSAAGRMVAANELEWVRLHALIFERTGKGADAIRWAVQVLVRLPEPSASVTPEAML
jgi:hypothetical protein